MIVIDSKDKYIKPLWLDTDFPALLLDDFLDFEEAKELINDGEDFIKSQLQSNQVIHGGRIMIPWTSSNFKNLIKRSNKWKNFSRKFKKKAFNLFLEEINNLHSKSETSKTSIYELKKTKLANIEEFKLTSKLKFRSFDKKYKKLLDSKIHSVPPDKLFTLSIIRLIDSIWIKIYSLKYFLFGKKPLIPLFDYSFSGNGYGREIHRDYDNRLIVVLLYLNTLDKDSEGGDLEIYKLNQDHHSYPPQPDKNDCELQYKIKPKSGRLLMFINQFNSYHAVSEMINNKKGRHFLYGGFTYPSSLFLNKKRLANSQLRTEMFSY